MCARKQQQTGWNQAGWLAARKQSYRNWSGTGQTLRKLPVSGNKGKKSYRRTTMRVAIYARVSTLNHGQDVSMQARELRQFAEARGWTVAGEYIDEGVSGTKE